MVIADCSVKDKLRKIWFFQKTFLLANIGLEVVLRMFFLIFSKADIWFKELKFVWRIYTATKALPTTRRVKIINKRGFVAAVLNVDNKTFVVYIASLAKPMTIPIQPFCQAQVASLMSKEIGTPAEYSKFSNIFSLDSTVELSKYIKINYHPINLLNDKQPSYCLIYSLRPVELKTLKTYIEDNLASSFITPSKTLANISILFVQKKNSSLRL